MRTIKFRGKCAKDSKYAGAWVDGGLLQCEKSKDFLIVYSITDTCSCTYHVDPNTVGQFTGLTDINGKEVYEGDVVRLRVSDNRYKRNPRYITKTIRYDNRLARFEVDGIFWINLSSDRIEVLGNIHDNPELLGEKGGEE